MMNPQNNLPQIKIGILGGTGLYQIDGLEILDEVKVKTPYGDPSDVLVIGTLEEKKVVFLNRHGRGHHILPSEINYRANIYAFKMLGVNKLVSINSVGSLKEDIKPRDIIFPDQFFDRTRRQNTFFGSGVAAHVSFAYPVCPEMSEILFAAGTELRLNVHQGGTYICIEGPSFSTIAESNIYRAWGCDVIGMTAATEAKLSREAGICYATMSLVTDYDVWHESEENVSVEMILENLGKNIENARSLLKKAVVLLKTAGDFDCECSHAIESCIVTKADFISPENKEKLGPIIAPYLDQEE